MKKIIIDSVEYMPKEELDEEAKQEALRRECMATRWIPTNEDLWCWDFGYGEPRPVSRSMICVVRAEILLGLAAPTKAGVEAIWGKYGKAWMTALEHNSQSLLAPVTVPVPITAPPTTTKRL